MREWSALPNDSSLPSRFRSKDRSAPTRYRAHSSASLADAEDHPLSLRRTVNDVVLAAVAGGYRSLLMQRGDDADRATLRSLVPVSTRHDDGQGVPDNRVSALLYELPVQLADPVERLDGGPRPDGRAEGIPHRRSRGDGDVDGGLVPPVLMGTLSRFTIRSMHRFGQRSLNTVTTNMPGPQFSLYCLGREMSEYRPFVPISHGLRVGTAILSYNGRLFFGVTGDYESVPEIEVLATETAATIERLLDRALVRLG